MIKLLTWAGTALGLAYFGSQAIDQTNNNNDTSNTSITFGLDSNFRAVAIAAAVGVTVYSAAQVIKGLKS